MRGSIDALLRAAAQVLSRAGVPSPAVDAELLLAHALHRELADLRRARLMGEEVPEATISTYQGLISRRAERVPVQHLTGRTHFAGVDLLVGPGVFIPRPETELMVELALTALEGLQSPTVVDLCTGSGALALAIAHARPDARVGAVELSPEAHRYAVAN
ncbi:MAG: HemK/PrmC family methyltransferase, partial [Ornithinimicrobium sp.]|uniref:N5-glutamine methyltransferase family protein n=1 Tax=Ornithinimicrobium sp. TaxID=1977084 RepID=UPI0026E103E9